MALNNLIGNPFSVGNAYIDGVKYELLLKRVEVAKSRDLNAVGFDLQAGDISGQLARASQLSRRAIEIMDKYEWEDPWVKIAFKRGQAAAKETKLYKRIESEIYTLALYDNFWTSENPLLSAEQRGVQ